jgi:hypothetical protein
MSARWFTMGKGRTWVELHYTDGRHVTVWLVEFDT